MNLAARYGGDEFICILSDTDLEGGRIHADRIVEAVAEHPILSGIGVSYGLATFEREMESSDELIRAADLELYQNKSRPDPG